MKIVTKIELTVESEGRSETFAIDDKKRKMPQYRDRHRDPILLELMALLTGLGLAKELPHRTEVSARRWRLVRQEPINAPDEPISAVKKRSRRILPHPEGGEGGIADK